MSFKAGLVYQSMRAVMIAGESFEWSRGSTPLSGLTWPVAGAAGYLAAVAILKQLIHKPVALPKTVATLHNLVLCVGSAVMLLGCASALAEEARHRGSVDFFFCTPPDTQPRGRLFFWSFVYYVSKYYEFADTLLQLLRKRPITFLGVFHHALVVPMAWLWLDQVQSLQWGGLLTNTAVHVVMYAYYFLTTLGIKPWWKQYITTFQIVQFASSFLTLIPFAMYQLRWRADAGGCAGLSALAYNAAFNACLLLLFLHFYAQAYKECRRKRQKEG